MQLNIEHSKPVQGRAKRFYGVCVCVDVWARGRGGAESKYQPP